VVKPSAGSPDEVRARRNGSRFGLVECTGHDPASCRCG
jgi:hypothetical protein